MVEHHQDTDVDGFAKAKRTTTVDNRPVPHEIRVMDFLFPNQ